MRSVLLLSLIGVLVWQALHPATAAMEDGAANPWDAALAGAQADFANYDVLLGECPFSAPDGTPPCVGISERVTWGDDAAIIYGLIVAYAGGSTAEAALFFYLIYDGEGWRYLNAMAIQNSGFLPQPGLDARTNSPDICTPAFAAPSVAAEPAGCVPHDTSVLVIDGPTGREGTLWWQLDGYGWVAHQAFGGYARSARR